MSLLSLQSCCAGSSRRLSRITKQAATVSLARQLAAGSREDRFYRPIQNVGANVNFTTAPRRIASQILSLQEAGKLETDTYAVQRTPREVAEEFPETQSAFERSKVLTMETKETISVPGVTSRRLTNLYTSERHAILSGSDSFSRTRCDRFRVLMERHTRRSRRYH